MGKVISKDGTATAFDKLGEGAAIIPVSGAFTVRAQPTMVTAFPHCEPGSPLHVDDQEVIYWAVSGHGTLFNYTGHPAVVLPYKLDRDGLPLGIQLVGKRWDESHLLAMAKAFSEVTGPFQRPPGY